MSGYYVGYEEDVKARDYGMLATAEDEHENNDFQESLPLCVRACFQHR